MSSEINKSKLDSLENDRQLLVDQLLAKSVQADTSETMTSLVGKVNTIVTGELEPDPYVAPSHTFNMYYDDRTTYNTALSIFDSAYEPYISWVLGQVENYCVRDVCPGILSLHLKSSYSFTPNKTSLRYFCSYLPYLTSLTIDRGFLPSTITDMEGFLSACDSLVEVDLRNLDVSNVTNFESFFEGCSSLTTINFDGWNTTKGVNFDRMFVYCSSLKHLDISSFTFGENLSIRLYGMFNSYLEYLDISGFDFVNTSGSTFSGVGGTFSQMNKNCFIYVKDQANLDYIQNSRSAYDRFTNIHVKEV